MASDPDNPGNPFDRPSVWPRVPQAPIWIGGRPIRPPQPATPPVAEPTPLPSIFSGGATPLPLRPPPPQLPSAPFGSALVPIRPPRQAPPPGPRLTPLIAAGAVGVGGLVALFLLIEGRPQPPALPASRSTLTVGALVSPVELPPATPGRLPRP